MVTRFCLALLLVVGWNHQVSEAVGPGSSQVYRGSWTSQSTGHQGPMRVRLTPRADGQTNARFTGRFLVVVPFTYRTTLQSFGFDGHSETLTASKQLGPLLGSYEMSANKTSSSFNGSFRAAGDTGVISMRRVR